MQHICNHCARFASACRAPHSLNKSRILDQRSKMESLDPLHLRLLQHQGQNYNVHGYARGRTSIYPYILGGGFRLPGASGPLGHWPASANGASKSARKMTCKRLPKCVRNGSRNEPKRLPATLLVASRITFQNRPLLRGSKM